MGGIGSRSSDKCPTTLEDDPMSASTFACPQCHAPLKFASPIPAGKKVKCPKCGAVFPVGTEATEPTVAIQPTPKPPTPATVAHGDATVDWKPGKAAAATKAARKPPRAADFDDEDDRDRKSASRREPARSNTGLIVGL